MPLYEFGCSKCEITKIVIQAIGMEAPECCGVSMEKILTYPAMVKVKGEGGYPSRRKFVKGSAPYTTRGTKAWKSEDPSDKTVNYMVTKSFEANREKT